MPTPICNCLLTKVLYNLLVPVVFFQAVGNHYLLTDIFTVWKQKKVFSVWENLPPELNCQVQFFFFPDLQKDVSAVQLLLASNDFCFWLVKHDLSPFSISWFIWWGMLWKLSPKENTKINYFYQFYTAFLLCLCIILKKK